METQNRDEWQEVFDARVRLGMDVELFYALLYDYLAVARQPRTAHLVRYLEEFMEKQFDGDTARWCREIHKLALDQLEKDISALGLAPRRTANELAQYHYGVDDAHWLKCWQLTKLVYLLGQEGLTREAAKRKN